MDSDPDLQLPESIQEIPPNLQELWFSALDDSLSGQTGDAGKVGKIDLQRMVAETIARAHQRGIPGLDQAVGRLERIVSEDSTHPAARFAAARALIVLESKSSAETLFSASQVHGADIRQLVEPALADWKYGPAVDLWRSRLTSEETRPRDLILAIRGLGRVGEPLVQDDLLSIVGDATRDPGLRFEAAAAAGLIATAGLEPAAELLLASAATLPIVNQLCAIRLLAGHSSEAATQLLTGLAGGDEPAVAAAALKRLNEIDSSLVLPLAEAATQNSDPEVRRQGVICLLRLPESGRIASLSRLLADKHPGVRGEVGEGLLQLSERTELAGPIRDAAMDVLAGEEWQGHEQASLLLGALEHRPAANRLIELLDSPRAEVRLPAAWALRKLAVPDTVPVLIAHLERLTELRRNQEQPGIDEQVAHLCEALGVLRATDATPELLKYVPKRINRNDRSRSAAIWALGRIYEETRDADIESALAGRVTDFEPQPRERIVVKQMAATALGRMRADDQAQMLQEYAASLGTEVATGANAVAVKRLELALIWAVKQLTGEELPPPKPIVLSQDSWFLEPIP